MDRNQIRKGMTVRDVEGDKLGKVADVAGDTFIIEKGLLFKEDFEARMERIVEIRDDEIIYARAAEASPEPQSHVSGVGDDRIESDSPAATATPSTAGREQIAGERDELRVPIVEEELDVQKQARQRGAVRVTKEVVTEQKQVTVPVTREEVIVERVPAGGDIAPASAGAFVETEIAVPAVEEEVVVTKRPVVREEVRVRKEQVQEQRAVTADVRREEAHVENLQDERRERPTETTTEPGMRAPGTEDDTKR
ncbi:MAG: hypothetical protein JWM53_5819 [bacterium]|nr:hypothetical protein [bacterium]